MATRQIPFDWKHCATCRYWAGRVTPDFSIKRVIIDRSERAKCPFIASNSVIDGEQSCSKWSRRF